MPYPIKHEHFEDNYAKIFSFLFSSFFFCIVNIQQFPYPAFHRLANDDLTLCRQSHLCLYAPKTGKDLLRDHKETNKENKLRNANLVSSIFRIFFRVSLACFEWQGG